MTLEQVMSDVFDEQKERIEKMLADANKYFEDMGIYTGGDDA